MLYAVLSDIHANLVALDAVLSRIKTLSQERGPIELLVLGDLVGYGPMRGAAGCLSWLRKEAAAGNLSWIPGNHDEWLQNGIGKLSPYATVSLLAQRTFLEYACSEDYAWFKAELSRKMTMDPQTREEADSLLHLSINNESVGSSWFVVGSHGTLKTGTLRGDYIFAWQPLKIQADLSELSQKTNGDRAYLFVGHTHFPMFIEQNGGQLCYRSIQYGRALPLGASAVINPGSVGAPRDGDKRAAFALLDTQERTVTFERVPYTEDDTIFQLEIDAAISSADYPLPVSKRNTLLNQAGDLLGWEQGRVERRGKWRSVYEKLISRLRSGDGQTELSKFYEFYMPFEGGLRAVKSSTCENVQGVNDEDIKL